MTGGRRGPKPGGQEPVVYIDLDGPILDVTRRYHRLYADFVRAHHGQALPQAAYWKLKRSKTPDVVILRKSGVSASLTSYQAWWRLHVETRPYLNLDRPWPRISEFLSRMGSAS